MKPANFSPKKKSSSLVYKMTCFSQALFSKKILVEFWLSVYKSYPMIGVEAIEIMLTFALYASASMDFLL